MAQERVPAAVRPTSDATMNNLRLAFAGAALVLFGLATVPNAVADTASDTSASAVSLFQCSTYNFDAQHDGHAEQWKECSTPACGCMCPYVGAGVVIEVPAENVGIVHTDSVQDGAFVITSGCQTAYGTTQGPGDGGPVATPLVFVGGGAIGDVGAALSLP
jgi:hypothetical protein